MPSLHAADLLIAISIASPILAIIFFFLWLKRRRDLKSLADEVARQEEYLTGQIKVAEDSKRRVEERFSAVLDIETKVQKVKLEHNRVEADLEGLRSSYKEKRQIYDRLLEKVAIFDELNRPEFVGDHQLK